MWVAGKELSISQSCKCSFKCVIPCDLKGYQPLTLFLSCKQMSCWCWRSLWSSSSSWWAFLASCRVTRALASSSSWSRCPCWVTTLICAWVKRCPSHMRSCSSWKRHGWRWKNVCTCGDTKALLSVNVGHMSLLILVNVTQKKPS